MAKVAEFTPVPQVLFSLEELTQEQINYLYSLLLLTRAGETLFDDTDGELFSALSEAATGEYTFSPNLHEPDMVTPTGFKLYEN